MVAVAGMRVAVEVKVGVGVIEAVLEAVKVDVIVGVREGVGVLLGVDVRVGVEEAVGVNDKRMTSWAVSVAFGVAVPEGVRLGSRRIASCPLPAPPRMRLGNQ